MLKYQINININLEINTIQKIQKLKSLSHDLIQTFIIKKIKLYYIFEDVVYLIRRKYKT